MENENLKPTHFQDGKRKIELPLVEAFQISLEQIRKRLKRSIILICSIALGIALFTYLQMTNIIFSVYMSSTETTIEAYQSWLIIISLFVCGIGLINANIIATYERYREIGTMKCLGALDQHILMLFLVEAFIFGFVGGLLGFSIGTVISIASSSLQLGTNVFWIIPIDPVLRFLGLTIVLSIFISTGSTIYPALKAAKLNPIEALRYNV